MPTLRPSRPQDGARIIDIWRRAVDATHHFLAAADRQAIDAEVCGFLPHAPLLLAVDADDVPMAFMLVVDGHMEALFVDPAHHGRGLGRLLVQQALRGHPRLGTDVNAQNAQAMAFYARLGFVETGRSPLDGQGRPYPLVHLRHAGAPSASAGAR
ncbi:MULTISPECIES: acetyltransferase [Stenotrophomonas]|uniref:Acetyltransferase n=1 Tax=Stenotrophomonas nitritireducens TaxID=83617 RepID=A0ABR5NGP7_9GAMM|nr:MULTISPECIES: acetyltransferase [Stenotrophomonas]KQO02532.1 acetyltransferase [Stenotrophomonas sp. Leaf70]KRG54917.1 acetyltransferase [Stenotrophomonas nitritireducens]MBN8768823.1 acetyltransferase [Stenotrophomonas sp.]MBN8792093.1 acetyltransferase [Stenotrophomonas nitritireducens]